MPRTVTASTPDDRQRPALSSSAASAGDEHRARCGDLHQPGDQVHDRAEVVALPRGRRPDADRTAGRRQHPVGGDRGPAQLGRDRAGGVDRGRGEEHLVADHLHDPATGQHRARPGVGLEPGERQALLPEVELLGPCGRSDQVHEAEGHPLTVRLEVLAVDPRRAAHDHGATDRPLELGDEEGGEGVGDRVEGQGRPLGHLCPGDVVARRTAGARPELGIEQRRPRPRRR